MSSSFFLFLSFLFPCMPACLSRLTCERRSGSKKKTKDCARLCAFFFMSHKAPVLEKPHAEVVILHRAAFSKWADYFFTRICLPPFHPLHRYLTDVSFLSLAVCLSICPPVSVTFPLIPTVFQSALIHPPAHTRTHSPSYTHLLHCYS